MKIIVSPDSFKGSLSATDAAKVMAEAIHNVDETIETVLLPVADGGEGTLNSLVNATNGKIKLVRVQDPLGRMISAEYGILGDEETCMIEMAKSSGLTLLSQGERNPLTASTYGTGEIILHALNAGYRKFVIGIGGSATNDGGTGMLRALGMKFLDTQGMELAEGAEALQCLEKIDTSNFDERIKASQFVIACDVNNPLVGPNGATTVFGPQKGATEEMVKAIDANLNHLADLIEKETGIALHQKAGAGAAGGIGGAFLAFFPVHLKPGIDVVMTAIDFEGHLQSASYVLTGEGKSDLQTLSGKAPIGIAKLAAKHHVPAVLISGYVEGESRKQLANYFIEIASVANKQVSSEESIANAAFHLKQRTYETVQRLLNL
ncbi:glycerate kinase [Rummeliibacillus pycnus]|uniref:glycerate kinase n=1 Tax=Rummeliibacillus pycnus TaxID=101070 RepID=UPI0037C927A7